MKRIDYTLERLLDLSDEVYELGGGFWVKIIAKRIKQVSKEKPFGVKYSLTLHDPNGRRLLGYDNAHAMPGKKRGRVAAHDHTHKNERIVSYSYESAAKLLEDFWADVDKVLTKRGQI